jgi:hypothetical protein
MGFEIGQPGFIYAGQFLEQYLFIIFFQLIKHIKESHDLKVLVARAALNVQFEMPLFRFFERFDKLE